MQGNEGENVSLECPVCGRLTDSLKQYRYVNWCLYLGIGALWEAVYHRACPDCMRQFIWERCRANRAPANMVWLIGLVPWAVALTAASRRPGHSRAVLRGESPALAAARESASLETSEARIWGVLSVLLCWIPVIGLGAAALGYWLAGSSAGWPRRAAQIGLCGAVLVHIGLAVAVTLNVVGFL